MQTITNAAWVPLLRPATTTPNMLFCQDVCQTENAMHAAGTAAAESATEPAERAVQVLASHQQVRQVAAFGLVLLLSLHVAASTLNKQVLSRWLLEPYSALSSHYSQTSI